MLKFLWVFLFLHVWRTEGVMSHVSSPAFCVISFPVFEIGSHYIYQLTKL